MSDTPETDDQDDYGKNGEWAKFARRLERERDEAREQNVKLRDIAEEMFFYVQHTVIQEKFRAELDQLMEGAK